MTSKRESEFQREIVEAFRFFYPGVGNFIYKIPDMPHGHQTRKPFDLVVSHDGMFWAVETKLHTCPGAWPLYTVKEHQIQALRQVGNTGLIFVNVTVGDEEFFRVFYTDEFLAIGRPSIGVADMAAWAGVVRKRLYGRKWYWELPLIFGEARSGSS